MKVRLHKVTCVRCGKEERIEITEDGTILSKWVYYGRIDVNAYKTNKWFYEYNEVVPSDFFNKKNWKKVRNKAYDSKAKRKYVELWECPECGEEES